MPSITRKWIMQLLLGVLFFVVFINRVGAQNQTLLQTPGANTQVDNIIPPSPEAAALGKYAMIPVGLYTGTPQIDIPVWNIEEDDIHLPISLSYHASGNKVEEIATRTGMGWVLNAGGAITRTIVGRADEYGYGGFLNFSKANTVAGLYTGTEQAKYDRWNGLTECNDAEPDQFSFSFAGYTGRFGFDWNQKIEFSCDRNIKIEPIGLPDPADQNFIQGFQITGDDGTVFQFEAKETNNFDAQSINPCPYLAPPVTSWYLTKIISNTGHWVKFDYVPYTLWYRSRTSEVYRHRYGYQDDNTLHTKIGFMKITGQYLSHISTSSGNTSIDFISSGDLRQDIPGGTSSLKSLGGIIVFSKQQPLKRLVFAYDYSIGRLTLKSIQEVPANGNTAFYKPPYQFAYNTAITLPRFDQQDNLVSIMQQDHWGYYNSNISNMLTPPYTATLPDGRTKTFEGGDRSPDLERMKAGILTQIIYPTGGTTTFDYEPHDYSYIGKTVLPANAMMGGLRIKRITDFDGENTNSSIIRKFEYKTAQNGQDVSSGVISALPRYNFDTYVFDQAGEVSQATFYKERCSASVLAYGTTQGGPIGYRKVSVLYGENGQNGKTESYFTSFYDDNDQISNDPPFALPASFDYRRGLLTKQIDFKFENNVYTPVKQLVNEYDFDDQTKTSMSMFGLKVGKKCQGCDVAFNAAEDLFTLAGHDYILGVAKAKKSSETFFENNASFTTEENFEYDPALQFLQKQTAKSSEGKTIVTEYSYPFNYTAANSTVLTAMQQKHILSPIIEKIVKEKSADGNERVIDASFNQFGLIYINNGFKVLPYKELRFIAASPVTNFIPSTSASGNFDSRYYTEVATFNRYNDSGKLEQVTYPGDVVSSYIWGYAGSLPIAKIMNAPFEQCAFTSFEGRYDEGNWLCSDVYPNYSADSKTGERSFSGQVSSKNALAPGEYIVSLWAKGSGNITVNAIQKPISSTWQRYEWTLSNPGLITISSNGNLIDDLRLHPAGAQMKTFTYQPGIGITSSTDVNHKTVYYDYDAMGRLKNIKDQDNNIVKNYQYHYKAN